MNQKIEIEQAIPKGKENALHQKEIARIIGVTPNHVKALVKKAREQGALILSDTCGYWIAENTDEVQRFIAMSEKNAFTRLKTIKAIKQSLKVAKGQQTLIKEDIL